MQTWFKYTVCTDEDECMNPTVCKFGGTCFNLPGSYRCQCPPGRTGKNCETGKQIIY